MSNTTPAGYVPAHLTFDFDYDLPSIPGFVRRQGHGVDWSNDRGQVWTHWNGAEMPVFRLNDLVAHKDELARLFPGDWEDGVRVEWEGDTVKVWSLNWDHVSGESEVEIYNESFEIDGERFVEIGSGCFTWCIAGEDDEDEDE